MSWYYSEDDQQKGPVSRETLEEMAREYRLTKDQLIWTEEFGNEWRAAGTVPGIFPEKVEDLAGTASPETVPATVEVVPEYRAVGSTDGFAPNAELTRRAREALKGNWGLGIGVFVVQVVLTQLVSNLVPVMGPFISFFLSAPLAVGLAIVFLNIARSNAPEFGQLFEGFNRFWNALGVYLLSTLFVFLWMLLLIIPGLIAAIAYSQVYFLLADHPNLSPMDALRSSIALMRGHKWQYFFLGLRFLGWSLLAILTLGIGLLWLFPYMQTAYAEFYLELRAHQKRSDTSSS